MLSSLNGGILGQFQAVQVLVEGCSSLAVGVPNYQQYSLSVAFNIEGGACGLSRAAVIGVSIGAVAAGVIVSLVLILVIKVALAKYTQGANAQLREKQMQDLTQPLLRNQDKL